MAKDLKALADSDSNTKICFLEIETLPSLFETKFVTDFWEEVEVEEEWEEDFVVKNLLVLLQESWLLLLLLQNLTFFLF